MSSADRSRRWRRWTEAGRRIDDLEIESLKIGLMIED
jgi:hypothetical protein